MRPPTDLVFTEEQYRRLVSHLFPGDGLEAGAVVLCGRCAAGDRLRLVTREVLAVPLSASRRTRDSLAWPSAEYLVPLAERLENEELSLVLAHSHPGGHEGFSRVDDRADMSVLGSVASWIDDGGPNGSMVALPNGEVVGRTYRPDDGFVPIRRLTIVGREIRTLGLPDVEVPMWGSRVAQTFGRGTWAALQSLCVGVVGCSGTGSLVVEQLARTGVGELVLVDPKRLHQRNLNRILGATESDAAAGCFKVDVMARGISAIGSGTKVTPLAVSIHDRSAALALAGCDVIFGCVDSVEGRYILDVLANAYVAPYFDVGVHIEPDGNGGIKSAVAAAHYVVPGGSSLLSRGVYTAEQLAGEGTRRVDPDFDQEEEAPRYLASVGESQPAVMPLNMLAAALGVTDLLARLHGFRMEGPEIQRLSLVHGSYFTESSSDPCPTMQRWIGRGSRAVDDLRAEMCAT